MFSEIKEKIVGGTVFQVVYVGKFLVRNDAEDFLQIINSKYNLNGRIVELRREWFNTQLFSLELDQGK